MSDDFDDLKRAFDSATPTPDAARKARTLAEAQKNFRALQEGSARARLTSDAPEKGAFGKGVRRMIDAITTRGGLTATTALVAVGFLVLTPLGDRVLAPDLSGPAGLRTDTAAPRQAPAEAETPPLADLAEAPEAVAVETAPIAPATRPIVIDRTIRAPAAAEMAVPEAEILQKESRATGLTAMDEALVVPPSARRVIVAPEPGTALQEADTEAFANEAPSSVKVTRDEPVSTFSVDVDTASYAVVRSSLMAGMLPPEAAVRVEEMVNYFPYDYPAPTGDAPFSTTVTVLPSPWNAGTELVHIGLQGTLPAIVDRPPLNLVFLIDTSGSMQAPNKLSLLKQSFRLMLSELRPQDEVSIVTYAGSAGQVLPPTPATERSTILAALDRLEAGGSTAGEAGLEQAYSTAEAMAADGEVTRVILATDGDFNVGLSDPSALEDLIARKRDSGTYLSVLGFGRGNLDDATMQALAQNGNGQAAYIDTLSEARKVLVDQLTGALFPIAGDVKVQVEFNPARIAEYRLIGYETRGLTREDFNNDRVDAGDIGAGHRVTAIYEVTPVGSDAVLTGPLRYADDSSVTDPSGELGYLKLRYKEPGEEQSKLIETPILPEMGTATPDVHFSVAVAGFGQLLRGGHYLGGWGFDEAIDLATGARGDDPFGYRAEAIDLMRLAEALSR
ncbi:DUF3520 domain-containing protein [Alphaproteobacteria bacterium GH1-50]|uniref:DUF3520 domain-containing protein n=1 Tax=Kangsaoukella pontilimi TaxID=2691042 RepID=A0A7C9IH82_9RHOB|nr:VWA domain-containing protein [Kangsaoukella pontilimi]MXQ08864.1 DUF3520 domain-containing protein [Kangsaoukella pontilimi]